MIEGDAASMNGESFVIISVEVGAVGVRYVDFSCVVSYG